MKVTVTQEVQVPSGLVLYDVADEKIVCQCCRASKVWEIEGDRITSSAPPLSEFFKDFV